MIDSALAYLGERSLLHRRIARVRLTNFFNIVQLDDGSVGAAANYASLTSPELEERRRSFEREIRYDPLLLDASRSPGDYFALSVRVAIISALSAPIIRQGGDSKFSARAGRPTELLERAQSAVVVGFGGYMHTLAGLQSIKKLHVADLLFEKRRAEMDAACARYQAARPDLVMTLSDGSDLSGQLTEADLICITGSALCNGSMESLLSLAAPCPRVIVQGQSAAIHPGGFFRRGATAISTTVKPNNLIDLSDDELRRTLEGGLPIVYLTPRHSAA